LQFAAIAQRSFRLLELLTDHAAEDVLLVRCAQRLRQKVDAALGQLGEVRPLWITSRSLEI
jgi:hypothetical protein